MYPPGFFSINSFSTVNLLYLGKNNYPTFSLIDIFDKILLAFG